MLAFPFMIAIGLLSLVVPSWCEMGYNPVGSVLMILIGTIGFLTGYMPMKNGPFGNQKE